MKRATLYSSSRPATPAETASAKRLEPARGRENKEPTPSVQPAPRARRFFWRNFGKRYQRLLWFGAGALGAAVLLYGRTAIAPTTRAITQEDISAAVLHTLETNTLPAPAARAYQVIRPSIVRVRRLAPDKEGLPDKEEGVGTGVVIVDKGIILTNLHVVLGARRVQVVFADGLESEATITGVQPENDLAVLQAQTIPDDLVAATLRSTADLALGDHVVAAGFPFGIGPSVSAGVVSGLRREFTSPEGKRVLTNLIQFDAAINPGSSGGPLVNAEGEVVGIVTAILNPTNDRFFVGIGFAVPIENAAAAVGVPPF